MIGSVPIGIWLTLPIKILPSDLKREGILRTEDGITPKGSHCSAIKILHLAQLFRQISDIFALDINLELLEASEICRQFTHELIVIKANINKLLCCNGIRQEIIRNGTSEYVSI